MTTSLTVCHGRFGRATLNRLSRPLATHAHREGHIIVTLRGTGSAIVSQGERLPLRRGSAVLIDPWRPHQFVPAGSSASEFLTLYIEPGWFSHRIGRPLVFGAPHAPVDQALEMLADDLAALLGASEEDDWGEEGADACREATVAELCARLLALSHGEGAGGDVASPSTRTVGDFRIRRALRLLRAAVEEDAGRPVDLGAVARGSGLSRPHFFKLFQIQVGVTPGTYVNALKMERSYERLAGTEDSVTAIGLDLGFASQAGFTRFFIAHSGISPSQYRDAVADAVSE